MAEVRLIYFDIRGLIEPLRWMLTLAGQPFEDDRIPLDAWATARKRSSAGDKDKLAAKEAKRQSVDNNQTIQRFKAYIGQLPILYFDDVILTQTLAVTRFIARKYGYIGEDQMQEARADEIADLVYDLRLQAASYNGSGFRSKTPDIVRHTVFRDFNNEPESPAKNKMREDLTLIHFPLYFLKFSNLLKQSGGEYVTGKTLTYGDLILANFFEIVEELIDPSCLDEFPELREMKNKILAMPAIDEWRKAQKASAIECGFPEGG